MARSRDQGGRRQQIMTAATVCALERGLFRLRIRDVADRLGLTEGAILYYHSSLEELRLQVYARASRKWFEVRDEVVLMSDSATEQLVSLVESAFTESVPEVRLLEEPVTGVAIVPAFRAVAESLFIQEVSRYRTILERGDARGEFTLRSTTLDAARNLVSLEESYRVHALAGTAITAEEGVRLVLSYASLVTSCELSPRAGRT